MGNGVGVSFVTSGEELLTAALLMETTAQMFTVAMPGMYRLYDFHSSKAPKIKAAQQPKFRFNFLMHQPDSDDESEEEEDDDKPIDDSEYGHYFKVMAGEDAVYIENPICENDAGWTPLHTCCMNLSTVDSGLKLIRETIR